MFATRVVKPEAKPHTSSTDQHKHLAGIASQATREAARNCCFNLSKIPIFPPGRTDQPQSTLGASHASVVQPKLVVGPVNDPLEREADRVADQVMVMPAQTSVAGTNPRIQPFSTSSASEALATSASARVDKRSPATHHPLMITNSCTAALSKKAPLTGS